MSSAIKQSPYWQKLAAFSQRVPYYLSRQAETVALSQEVEQTLQMLNTPHKFNLTVSGRFKQGKSTLINALIGRNLPIVGANPTTATITFLDYGKKDEETHFQVRWNAANKADSRFPLADIEQFMGESEQATVTTALYLKVESEFLKTVRLIDTPGTGNVGDSHQKTADHYFDRSTISATSLAESEKADALIHVLPFAPRPEDMKELNAFGQRTRPFGASAYNSLAVIQFWEAALACPEPLRVDLVSLAERKAAEFQQQLAGQVTTLLPVSGLLYLASLSLPLSCLQTILERIETMDDATLNKFIAFKPKLEREAIYQQVHHYLSVDTDPTKFTGTLSVLRTLLWAARFYQLDTAEALQQKIAALSGIEHLKTVLQQRFFSIADLIKAGVILSKASLPCEKALHLLRQKKEESDYIAQQGHDALEALTHMSSASDPEANTTVTLFIKKAQQLAEDEARRLEETCQAFAAIHSEVMQDFKIIMDEIACLKRLEDDAALKRLLNEADSMELRYLFGQYGVETHDRLQLEQTAEQSEQLDKAWALKRKWHRKRLLQRTIKDAISDRLDSLLDALEV